jgi:hypothetical protein
MEPKRQWQGSSGGGPQAKKQNTGPSFHDPLEDDLDLEAGLAEEDEDQRLLEDDLDIELGEAGRNWERPPVPPFDPQQEKLSTSIRTFILHVLSNSCSQQCQFFLQLLRQSVHPMLSRY